MTFQAIAEPLVKLPEPELLRKGSTAPEDVGYYRNRQLEQLIQYRQQCESCREQNDECIAISSKIIETTPWYQSKIFWLATGIGVGLGGAIVIQAIY